VRLADSVRVVLASMTTPPDDVELDDGRRAGRQQDIEQALFGIELGFIGHVFELFFANHFDGDLDQIADHGFYVAAHVADFGELGGLHF
jgi:hypothetical protein